MQEHPYTSVLQTLHKFFHKKTQRISPTLCLCLDTTTFSADRLQVTVTENTNAIERVNFKLRAWCENEFALCRLSVGSKTAEAKQQLYKHIYIPEYCSAFAQYQSQQKTNKTHCLK